jgi:hypothetical protein
VGLAPDRLYFWQYVQIDFGFQNSSSYVHRMAAWLLPIALAAAHDNADLVQSKTSVGNLSSQRVVDVADAVERTNALSNRSERLNVSVEVAKLAHNTSAADLTEEFWDHIPQAVIVGMQKCGTTTLQTLLKKHPEVQMYPYEMDCFQDTSNLSAREYQDCMASYIPRYLDNQSRIVRRTQANLPSRKSGLVMAKSTTDYAYPEDFARLNPRAKIIFSIRDPVERAYSAYHHGLRDGGWGRKPSLQVVLSQDAEYFEKGLYAKYLERWVRVLSPSQIFVSVLEEMEKADYDWSRLQHFLGLTSPLRPSSDGRNAPKDPYDPMPEDFKNELSLLYAAPNERLCEVLSSHPGIHTDRSCPY